MKIHSMMLKFSFMLKAGSIKPAVYLNSMANDNPRWLAKALDKFYSFSKALLFFFCNVNELKHFTWSPAGEWKVINFPLT